MKDFNRKLLNEEQALQKMSGFFSKDNMKNNIYRVSSFNHRIDLQEDFSDSLLDLDIGSPVNFDEKQFVVKYDQIIQGLMLEMPKMLNQIEELKEQYMLMQGSLSLLSQNYQDDPSFIVLLEIYANTAKLYGG